MPLGAARLSLLAYQAAAAAAAGRTAVSVTAFGNTQIDTAQSKFGGASALFDGLGDYLDLSGQTIALTGDWTFETWIRSDVIGSSDVILRIHNSSDSFIGSLYVTNGKIATYIGGGGTTGTTVMSADTWYHVAWCRDGSTIRMYINGVQEATRSYSLDQSACNLYIGHYPGDSNTRFNGWLDDARLSDTARYPSGTSFTPATTSLTNDNNTLFLLHMDGTDGSTVFTDDTVTPAASSRTAVSVTAFGNTQIDTSLSKFGGASAYFDGSGDYIHSPDSDDWELGSTQDTWTIEWWQYLSALPNSYKGVISHQQTGPGESVGWGVYISNTNKLTFAGSTTSFASGYTTLSANQWQHCAIVRQGSTLKYYIDGALDYTNTNYTNKTDSVARNLAIGYAFNVSNGYNGELYFPGRIDELRISHVARYTGPFVPQTSTHANDAATVLLMHMDGTDGSTVFTDDASAPGVTATGGTVSDVTIDGVDYRIHEFTSSGSFIPTTSGTVDVLLVGGGGGGLGAPSSESYSVGGGGGGVIYQSALTLTPQSYAITVGSGGNGNFNTYSNASQGGTTTAFGYNAPGGGGGGDSKMVVAGAGDSGRFSLGDLGGKGYNDANGGNNGGNGLDLSYVFGTSYGHNGYYGGGGSGAPNFTGGLGGGGSAGSSLGSPGMSNTGGGGAGSRYSNTGGTGGSGVVIIRYQI